MTVNDFIKFRQKDWRRLESLMSYHKGRNTLSAEEALELGTLYRAITSDLALARRDYPNQRVTLFLNQLLTRAHSFIYQQDVSDFRRLIRYFTHTIPQSFRTGWLFTLMAFLLFMVPGVTGYQLGVTNPDIAGPLGLVEMREMLSEQDVWTNIPIDKRPYASAFIMSNNIRIAILAFGGGVGFGLFSLYILAINGLTIGAVLGLAVHYGMGESLFSFILPHGVIELSVVFIAGGAGLQLGWALLNPGLFSRRDALNLAARRVVPLVVISILLLIIAGLIEGFISPSDVPFGVRVLVAGTSGVLMYGYLSLAGRIRI